MFNFKFIINDKLYNKDPETSILGKNIIKHSINLIEDIGYEQFTFKKLGEIINSNESSIYRYFDNKHNLLIYLSSWYWLWVDFQITQVFINHSKPEERLWFSLKIIVEKANQNTDIDYVNEEKLHQIVINEYSKTFLTKAIDNENQLGFYLDYKKVIYKIIQIFNEINIDYMYKESLASTIVQGALHQHFLSLHLKTITNFNENIDKTNFYYELIMNTLKK
jgi:hypothetical protein